MALPARKTKWTIKVPHSNVPEHHWHKNYLALKTVHFWVPIILTFETSRSAKPFLWKWIIKKHFHINGFTLSLVLKQRLRVTRKWPQERFYVTSRRPYWCSKTMKRWPACWCSKPILMGFFSYVNPFICSNKFVWMLATWVKTPNWSHSVYLVCNFSHLAHEHRGWQNFSPGEPWSPPEDSNFSTSSSLPLDANWKAKKKNCKCIGESGINVTLAGDGSLVK